jgi:hypothetical protein
MAKQKTRGTLGASKPQKAATPPAKSPPRRAKTGPSAKAASRIDERIGSLGDWRGTTLAQVRRLIRETCPEVTEYRKWIKPSNPLGVAVWSHPETGIICTGETYKQVVKLTFPKGASLEDPSGLFNASLDGNTRRAIDMREGEVLDAKAFKALIRAAAAENRTKCRSSAPRLMKSKSAQRTRAGSKSDRPTTVKLLSGGNPQIAKADGDAPVQAYIAAMPGWKRSLGKRLDALIVRAIPTVRKAVRWNSPFYGIEGQGWFLSFHVFTRYVKVTFFQGASLRPIPPGAGKDKNARWIDIYEDDHFDQAQMVKWVQHAAALPGWVP